jgi:hypothetical protein
VDQARTHEVRFAVDAGVLTVVESAVGESDPAASLVTRQRVVDEWEATSHRAELEARLGMLGAYWRSDGSGWRNVPRRSAIVDLRPVDVELQPERHAAVHAFHHPAKADRMLLALPAASSRAMLAELELRALAPTAARLLHSGLPAGPMRSLLAHEHLRAHDAGYGKLRTATELAFVYGPDWRTRFTAAIRVGLDRIRAEPAWREDAEAAKSAHDPTLEARAHALLLDPRLAIVSARFLGPGEEEDLLRAGSSFIERAIAGKRRGARSAEQHLLSVLEASLLLRERLRRHASLETELVERVHRLSYYLPGAAQQGEA